MNTEKPKRDLQGLVKIVLGMSFPFFFLLHWNGFLSFTWFIPLSWVGLETSFLPQMLAALASAVIIYLGLFVLSQIIIGLITTIEDDAPSDTQN